jgi:hypothetical protein
MEYGQRVIMRFLRNEEVDAHEIMQRLQAQFGDSFYALRTVQHWIGEIRRGCKDLHDEIRIGRPALDHLDTKILAILNKSAFESARSIAETLLVTQTIVLRHLHRSIRFKTLHLHWVRHLLTDDLRAKRKEQATVMLPYLLAAQNDGWQHLVAGDESWFFLDTTPRLVPRPSKDDVFTKLKLNGQSKKIMFTIMWNRDGFHVIDKPPNETKMNNHYFLANILIPLEQSIFPQGRVPHQKRVVVHVYNYPIDMSQVSTEWLNQHNIVHMLEPHYSPDLAPVASTCFATMKEKLRHIALRDEDQLFECLIEILACLDNTELNRVFHA